jgi:hypothetical protein
MYFMTVEDFDHSGAHTVPLQLRFIVREASNILPYIEGAAGSQCHGTKSDYQKLCDR